MKTIAILICILFSHTVLAGNEIEWNQKKFPEVFYLYREHGHSFGTLEENRESQEKSYESVKSMIQEAKASGLKFTTPVFFRLNLRQGKVVEGGLEIREERTTPLKKVTKIRPAGFFLTAEYKGKRSGVDAIFKTLPDKLRESSLSLSADEAYLYKTTGQNMQPDSYLILFPLRKK